MSERINTHDDRATIRWKLLTGASALALAAYLSSPAMAGAADAPIVWIEGGWHFEDVKNSLDPFAPPLDSLAVANGFPSITSLEKTLGYSYGGEGSISFQPEHSNWLFSASLRYGRAHGHRHVHAQTKITGGRYPTYALALGHLKTGFVTPTFVNYVEDKTDSSETHVIIDFLAGKDVGLGQLGQSVISFGARYVRAKAGSGLSAYEKPDVAFHLTRWNAAPVLMEQYVVNSYHNSASTLSRESVFQGIGPALSWRNTTPLAGNVEDGELTLDWGANAALLFGRQSVKGSHESTSNYHYRTKHHTGAVHYKPIGHVAVVQTSVPLTRSRRTTVPNVGGFAGISYRFTDAKLSLGYRVDYFFGMIDGGIDARDSKTRSFNGPYASISIGLGD